MSNLRNLVLIANPNAGRYAAATVKRVQAYYQTMGIEVLLWRGDMGSCFRDAISSLDSRRDAVVVIGGDGTLNQVINTLGPGKVTIGIIPAGTGNVFARELGVPTKDPLGAAEVTLRNQKRRLDLGLLDGRYFLLMAGIGFDGQVAARLEAAQKRRMGLGAYAWATMREIFKYQARPIYVKAKGHNERGSTVLICNTRRYGGPLTFAQKAYPDDGLLDVVVFRRIGFLPALRFFLMGCGFRYFIRERDLVYFQTKSLEVKSKYPIPVQIDGDYYGILPVRISVAPNSQDFLVGS